MNTNRQEKFCQFILKGMSAAAADRKAGYAKKYSNSHGPKLLKNPRIQARIAALKPKVDATVAFGIGMDRAWILRHLQANIVSAMREGLRAAANGGLKLAGLEQGMFGDVVTMKIEDLRKLPADELARMLATMGDPAESVQ